MASGSGSSQGRGQGMPVQNLNLVLGGNLQGGSIQILGSKEEIDAESGDVAKNGDGDPHDSGLGLEILPPTRKGN